RRTRLPIYACRWPSPARARPGARTGAGWPVGGTRRCEIGGDGPSRAAPPGGRARREGWLPRSRRARPPSPERRWVPAPPARGGRGCHGGGKFRMARVTAMGALSLVRVLGLILARHRLLHLAAALPDCRPDLPGPVLDRRAGGLALALDGMPGSPRPVGNCM